MFTVVNIAVLVLRKDRSGTTISVRRRSSPCLARSPAHFLPGLDGPRSAQYRIAGVLVAIGIALWVVTVFVNRATGVKPADPLMADIGGDGPKN